MFSKVCPLFQGSYKGLLISVYFWLKMKLLLYLITFKLFPLFKCLKICDNSTDITFIICSTDRNYDAQNPDRTPTAIDQIISLTSVSEIYEDIGTMSLDVVVKILWNDSRLELKPDVEFM